MRRTRVDQATAERLLAGEVSPDDAPRGFSRVSTLLGLARRARLQGSAGAAETLNAMQAAMSDTPTAAAHAATTTDGTEPGKRPSMKRTVVVRSALATVAALSLTGGLAAAESLPSPVQDTVASAGRSVGIRLPHSARHRAAKFALQQERLAAKCDEFGARGHDEQADKCRERYADREAKAEEKRQHEGAKQATREDCRRAKEEGDASKGEECRREREEQRRQKEQERREEQARREEACRRAESEGDAERTERCRQAEAKQRRAEECRAAHEAGDTATVEQCHREHEAEKKAGEEHRRADGQPGSEEAA